MNNVWLKTLKSATDEELARIAGARFNSDGKTPIEAILTAQFIQIERKSERSPIERALYDYEIADAGRRAEKANV